MSVFFDCDDLRLRFALPVNDKSGRGGRSPSRIRVHVEIRLGSEQGKLVAALRHETRTHLGDRAGGEPERARGGVRYPPRRHLPLQHDEGFLDGTQEVLQDVEQGEIPAR